MRNLLLSFFVLSFLLLTSCKEAANTETAATPDYAAFDKKVEVIRAFFKAQCDENLSALSALLSDTLKFSPTYYNENKWLGKEDLLGSLKTYHENFDNIKYVEGLNRPDSVAGGFYSGSVFPQVTATSMHGNIRCYGTWTATHKESGKNVGLKFFTQVSVNVDGKIVSYSDYFDINSAMPKNP